MQAIGYVRVSTEGQATDGVSLEAQRAKLEAWAVANSYTLEAVYVDAGLSGKRADNRPGLREALAHVTRTKGSALVVYSLSRLARSVRDTLAMAEKLDKAGADLVSLSERIDTTSAAGKMVFRMLAVMAEFERDLASERTSAALAYKRTRREKTGGAVPYGYQLSADGRTLEPHAGEQAALAVIRELRDAGASYRAVAQELNVRGLTTKEGAAWTHRQVARAERNASRWAAA